MTTPHTNRPIQTFEFLIQTPTTTEWVQIQGSGGPIGNGILYLQEEMQDRDFLSRMKQELLQRAKFQQRREGHLRVVRSPSDPSQYSFDIENVGEAQILEIREVRSKI